MSNSSDCSSLITTEKESSALRASSSNLKLKVFAELTGETAKETAQRKCRQSPMAKSYSFDIRNSIAFTDFESRTKNKASQSSRVLVKWESKVEPEVRTNCVVAG